MPSVESTFTYKNHNSEDYGLMLVNIDTSFTGNSVEKNATYEQRALRSQHRFLSTTRKHEEPYSFDLEIYSEDPLSVADQREITRWLFDSPTYGRMDIWDDDYAGIHYMCIFTNEESIIGGDGVHGWKCTMQCDAPYGWAEETTVTSGALTSGANFVFTNDSDEMDYMLAKIKLTVGTTGGTIHVQNTNNGNQMVTVENTRANESITIDQYGQISASTGRNCYDDYSGGIMRFVHGANTLVVTGDIVKIEITYQAARRVGL